MEVLRRHPLAIAQRLVHCTIALSTAVLDRITKPMSVAPLLTNNLDNSKQKTSTLLSPAPPPYSWSLLGKVEGPAPPPSSKTSWSFDLTWNPVCFLSWLLLLFCRSGMIMMKRQVSRSASRKSRSSLSTWSTDRPTSGHHYWLLFHVLVTLATLSSDLPSGQFNIVKDTARLVAFCLIQWPCGCFILITHLSLVT